MGATRLTPDYAERPVWHDRPPSTPPAPPLPASCDVVIVGAGYCGLAAAAELARRGSHVVVLEADALGDGASTRNAGMVIPELHRSAQQLVHYFGERGREMLLAALDACRLVEQLAGDGGIDCNYERAGGLYVAHHGAQLSHLHGLARDWTDLLGLGASVIAGSDLRDELGTDRYVAGVVLDGVAALHPARYHTGLAARAVERGAEIHCGTRAVELHTRVDASVVRTTRGELTASDVLVATNAEADALVPALRRRVLPVGSFIVATEPLDPSVLDDVIPRQRMVFDSRRLLSYWRRSPDGRVLFGGRTSLMPTTVAKARDRLVERMVDVHPQLAGARIARAWGGRVAITRDRLPHCGRIDGVAFAAGCNGTGIALATWLGVRVAAWMAGAEPLPVFGDTPFRRVPTGALRELTLPVAGWAAHLADRFGR